MLDKPTLDDAIAHFEKLLESGDAESGDARALHVLTKYRDSLQPRPELPGEMWGLWSPISGMFMTFRPGGNPKLKYGAYFHSEEDVRAYLRDCTEADESWLPVRLYPRPDSRLAEVLREASVEARRQSTIASQVIFERAIEFIARRLTELGLLEEQADA